MHLQTVFLVVFCFSFQSTDSARILGIVPSPFFSHQIVFRPLWRELSLRGHQLTVLTTDPMNDASLTNLTEIDLHFTYDLWNKNAVEIIENNRKNFFKAFVQIMSTYNIMLDQQLKHPPVQALIENKTEHFDLLIVELLKPTMAAFSERFKCPFIGMTSTDPPASLYDTIGNPVHPVLNPDGNLPFTRNLTFWQRLFSIFLNLCLHIYGKVYYLPSQQTLLNRHFGENFPPLENIVMNISMFFVNTNPILNQVRPLVPGVIQIGIGIHRQPPKPLPNDLQVLLDNATQGFIYFSLGTNVKSKDLSESTQRIILQAFSELPYLVLWKFELDGDDLPLQPKNVLVSKWYPQQDIFEHPKLKLFITQGGQQSIEEAVFARIPIIGMPFAGDQMGNVNRFVDKGLGLSLNYKKLDREGFKSIVLEVINNPKYRNKVKELAELIDDQPMTGLERAVWWTEYVLRHKGAKHLRSPSLDIPWYQYYLLDVIGFCSLVIFLAVYLLMTLIRMFSRLIKYFISKSKIKVE